MSIKILVLGTGRCGTSWVAGILHKLGVNMGKEFFPSDRNNEYGTFEDLDFFILNRAFSDFNPSHKVWDIYEKRLDRLINSKKGLWGVKDPCISEHPRLEKYLKHDFKIILCARPKKDVLNSLVKAYGWDIDLADLHYYTPRQENLDRCLANRKYLEIRFNEENKEEKIKKWLYDNTSLSNK